VSVTAQVAVSEVVDINEQYIRLRCRLYDAADQQECRKSEQYFYCQPAHVQHTTAKSLLRSLAIMRVLENNNTIDCANTLTLVYFIPTG
jgi:hypothetical protein